MNNSVEHVICNPSETNITEQEKSLLSAPTSKKRKKVQIQSRRFCFTSFNLETLDHLKALDTSSVKYLIVGLETCPKTKKKHLQGYLELPRKLSLTSVKVLLADSTAHLEIANGSSEENLVYCSKENLVLKMGSPMMQGTRSDLATVQLALTDGIPMEVIAKDHFALFLQHRKGFRDYLSLLSEKRTWKTQVIFLHGLTGTGKTRKVFEWPRTNSLYIHPAGDWFDGFNNEEDVLFDDFASDYGLSYGMLLRLLDRYPINCRVKGGFINFNPRRIFITSNSMPQDWFRHEVSALMRRIDFTIKISS